MPKALGVHLEALQWEVTSPHAKNRSQSRFFGWKKKRNQLECRNFVGQLQKLIHKSVTLKL